MTRSNQETESLSDCCDIPIDQIKLVPLSLRFDVANEMHKKEKFYFHCSRLRAENKNVPRLITAAKKFGFQLKLAGALHDKKDEKWLKDLIENSSNIECVG